MVGNGPYMHGVAAQRRGDRPRAQRQLGRRLQRRDLAGPRRADRVPDHRRPRHVVQRPRGRRDRHRPHPAGAVRGGAVQLGHHARRHRSLGSYHFIFNLARSARRWRGEPAAAPGDLDGDRPRRDQRVGLQRPAHASRRASRRRASPASPRTCATTAPTTPRQPRRPTTSGWPPATSRRRSRSSSTPMPATSRWWRSSSTTWRRSASRPRPTRGSRETYFTELADGACVFCRAGWIADYPTYDNFMYDLFQHRFDRRQQLRRTATRSSTPSSTRPRQTTDADARAQLFQRGRGHPAQPGGRP